MKGRAGAHFPSAAEDGRDAPVVPRTRRGRELVMRMEAIRGSELEGTPAGHLFVAGYVLACDVATRALVILNPGEGRSVSYRESREDPYRARRILDGVEP